MWDVGIERFSVHGPLCPSVESLKRGWFTWLDLNPLGRDACLLMQNLGGIIIA